MTQEGRGKRYLEKCTRKVLLEGKKNLYQKSYQALRVKNWQYVSE